MRGDMSCLQSELRGHCVHVQAEVTTHQVKVPVKKALEREVC